MSKTKQTTRLSTGDKRPRVNISSDAARIFTSFAMTLPEEEGLKLIINYQDCQKEKE